MRSTQLIASMITMLLLASPAIGLDFQLHENNSPNINAVLATGTVKEDDADRLDRFLSHQPRKR